jgi:ABC-type Mn2+/Zn2+ transport system ATPase subunit
VIDARGLAVGYRGGPAVLTDVTFSLAPGERVGVLGPNGVGQARAWDHVLCLNGRMVEFGPPEHVLTGAVLAETFEHAIIRMPDDRPHDDTQTVGTSARA